MCIYDRTTCYSSYKQSFHEQPLSFPLKCRGRKSAACNITGKKQGIHLILSISVPNKSLSTGIQVNCKNITYLGLQEILLPGLCCCLNQHVPILCTEKANWKKWWPVTVIVKGVNVTKQIRYMSTYTFTNFKVATYNYMLRKYHTIYNRSFQICGP